MGMRRRHFRAELKIVNTRPDDGRDYCIGDCTTRAMAYCLKGLFTYREIEHEQYRLAEMANKNEGRKWGDGQHKYHRNSSSVWPLVMADMGYSWISICPTIRRDRLAEVLNHLLAYPVITRSSGHVAVVENGFVIDTWDSRGGRCDRLMVKSNDVNKVMSCLEQYQFLTEFGNLDGVLP